MEESQPQTGHGPAAVAPTPKDKDGIIHLQLQQNQVHMNAPPQTQTLPQDNVDINAASSSCVPVEIPKGPTTESAEPSVEDMDLSDDSLVLVTKHAVSAEIGNGSGPEAALVHASRTSSAFIDQSPTIGGKRAPTESTEPSVSLVYNNLTRESKRELMELMQQWSELQATKQPHSTESAEQVLDCGEETYYPAIHVGSERPCAVSFWVDNNQARENAAVDVDVDDGAVPLYDREFTLGDSSNAESKKEDKKDDWRCLNCASSSHALKDCPNPHDHVAISMAREQIKLKRKISKVIRQQNRPLKRRYL